VWPQVSHSAHTLNLIGTRPLPRLRASSDIQQNSSTSPEDGAPSPMLLVFHSYPSWEPVLFLSPIILSVRMSWLELVESFDIPRSSPPFQVIRVNSMTWMIRNPKYSAPCAMRIVFPSWAQGSELQRSRAKSHMIWRWSNIHWVLSSQYFRVYYSRIAQSVSIKGLMEPNLSIGMHHMIRESGTGRLLSRIANSLLPAYLSPPSLS
jgi:hypothetical protein